ncbi:MAG TPA: hypothetical protein DDY49_10140 [Paenibacillaceae bacterium]|nr:hypothetical protein [Paenibacillaceae bacterium]
MGQLSIGWQWAILVIPAFIAIMIFIGGFFMFRKFLRKLPKKD